MIATVQKSATGLKSEITTVKKNVRPKSAIRMKKIVGVLLGAILLSKAMINAMKLAM